MTNEATPFIKLPTSFPQASHSLLKSSKPGRRWSHQVASAIAAPRGQACAAGVETRKRWDTLALAMTYNAGAPVLEVQVIQPATDSVKDVKASSRENDTHRENRCQ